MTITQDTNQLPTRSGADKDLDETIEFFAPELGLDVEPYIEKEDIQGIHHLGRYHWAKQVLSSLSPSSVLDIACGMGYGSYILAKDLDRTSVVGADYDPRGVDIARSTYREENLSYVQGNIVTWERSDGSSTAPLGVFDAIVSFDTIEHLLHREIALIRMAENLASDGVLLLSTPCGCQMTQLNPGWEHHKIEYSHLDLRNLLSRFFGKVLVPEDGTLPRLDYWEQVINRDKPRYLNLANPVVCMEPIKYS